MGAMIEQTVIHRHYFHNLVATRRTQIAMNLVLKGHSHHGSKRRRVSRIAFGRATYIMKH